MAKEKESKVKTTAPITDGDEKKKALETALGQIEKHCLLFCSCEKLPDRRKLCQGVLPPQVILGPDLPQVLFHPLDPQVPAGTPRRAALLTTAPQPKIAPYLVDATAPF